MFGWKIRRPNDTPDGIHKLQEALNGADAVIIGAGAGLSASAGFSYSGERFNKYFRDFAEKYPIQDMYSGGFYPFSSLEEHWAYWSRYIYINRYMDAPKPVYSDLLKLVQHKDYFVLTTNVDHQFQKAGFDRHRLFYTQGDYGLWQCSVPCHNQTYDNEAAVRKMAAAQGFGFAENGALYVPDGTKLKMEVPSEKAGFDRHRLFYTQGDYGLWQCSVPCHNQTYDNEAAVRKMAAAQGFGFAENGALYVPDGTKLKMEVPSELIPYCPHCHKPMTMNLRADDTFVEDAGWHQAAARYEDFLRRHQNRKVLFLELAVGHNTPTIVKYSFWRMTHDWPDAIYACLNYGEAYAPDEIRKKSICVNGDIGDILTALENTLLS